MKCHEKDGDSRADVYIKADGKRCAEFNSFLRDGNTMVGFIAVEDGQKITLDCGFNGRTRHVIFDLFIDGVLRNSIAVASQEWRDKRKMAKFERGYYFEKGGVKDGQLITVELAPDKHFASEDKVVDSVGTIEVRIAVNRYPGEPTHWIVADHTFDFVGDWRDAYPQPTYTILEPTHEVRIKPVGAVLSKQMLGMLRSRMRASRPGPKPWAVMRFYYRGKGTTSDAGIEGSLLRLL